MTALERMKLDARLCNQALRNLSGEHIENLKAEIAGKKPGPKSGIGWRNSPLTQKEIEDIHHFLNKGWDSRSIAQFVGVSLSTVDKYKYARA
mgnify:CR=1 FL=1